MNRNLPFYQNPLVLMHAAGWLLYIAGDYADHVFGYGVYYAVPSVGSGLAAYFLTGLVAIVASATQHFRMAIRVPIFLLALYSTSLIWNRLWIAFHTETEEKIIQALSEIPQMSLVQWLETGYVPLLLFLSWAGFYIGSKVYFAKIEQQEELHAAVLETQKAQLRTLRYQLNPHFLFNCLNSVDVSIQSDDKETAHKMIQYLTGFLRRSLEQGEQDKIPFASEIALIKDFVAIETLRFGEGLKFEMQVSPECTETLVPPMFLQPLVENALKFAWNQTNQGHVHVGASKTGAELSICITNSKSETGLAGTGTGLRNTRERLELLYGADATLQISDTAEEFKVELNLPWEETLS